ncbi:hypothetical protein [Roseisolibacter sp. H3M3-2]|uniref:hypothetical protein n=1 Tax=Roseisolibacter sp. H3M3-2 TaxID=3031323 RepID=UPI0023DCBF70|nr:hypothetical protein [Roseisolibacter sp. H3M3-2]MDF1506093.1 hypothetical protein [Roseisolibacter sp. H3M3-2]
MAEREQSESAREVRDPSQRDPNQQPPARNQGDGMEGAPTSNAGGGADEVGGAGERGREGQSDREGQGGYGNDTGFTGGTVGSRDDDSGASRR